MSSKRLRLSSLVVVSVTAVLSSASSARAQGASDPPTVRDFCIKVAPGKSSEYAAFLRDVTVPLAQARADAGEFAWFLAARGVVPAGTSAKCDYRIVYGYKGLPPEEISNEALDAALKRAKLAMTADQMVARRNALTTLVAAEIWFRVDGLGDPDPKGSYVRLNHYKVKDGEFEEWTRMERTYWKPIMESWLKGGGKGAWGVYGLGLPGGDSTPYNAMTVDSFPDWNGLMRGVPANELWPKVHPGTTTTDAFNRLARSRSIHAVEVYRLAEVVRAK
jgi:hypothetical protein